MTRPCSGLGIAALPATNAQHHASRHPLTFPTLHVGAAGTYGASLWRTQPATGTLVQEAELPGHTSTIRRCAGLPHAHRAVGHMGGETVLAAASMGVAHGRIRTEGMLSEGIGMLHEWGTRFNPLCKQRVDATIVSGGKQAGGMLLSLHTF